MWFKFGNRVGDSGVLKFSSNAIIIRSSRVLYSILKLGFFAIIISLMISWIAPIRLCALRCRYEVGSVFRIISCHYSFLRFRIGWSMSSSIDAWWTISTRLAALFIVILWSLSHLTLITLPEFFKICRLLCLLIILISSAESLIHFCIISFIDLRINKFVQVFP